MIRTVTLARAAEALARRTTHDDVDVVAINQLGKFFGAKTRQVLLEHVENGRTDMPDTTRSLVQSQVFPSRLNGLLVEVHGCKDLKPGADHPQTEPAAPAEQVEAGQRSSRRLILSGARLCDVMIRHLRAEGNLSG